MDWFGVWTGSGKLDPCPNLVCQSLPFSKL